MTRRTKAPEKASEEAQVKAQAKASEKAQTGSRAEGRPAGRPAGRLRGEPLLVLGAVLTALVVATCLVSLVWTPYDPTAMNVSERFAAPSLTHLLGTDQFGRDILSRAMVASQPALLVGLGSVALGSAAGIAVGLVAGMGNRVVNAVLMRVPDALMAFPGILLAMGLVIVLGSGLQSALIAIAVFTVPTFARLTCQTTLEIKGSLFIKAARSNGCRGVNLVVRHVLPHIAPRLATQFTASAGSAMLLEAALSFLGLGVQPPMASWGYMLSEAFAYVLVYPGLAVAPGLALMVAVLGFNLLGDGLNDWLVRREAGR